MFIFLVVILALATTAYIVAPLRFSSQAALETAPREGLRSQRDALLSELRELELDHAMGKIETNQFESLRHEASTQAAQVLQDLEVLPAASSALAPHIANTEAEAEAEIAVARARRQRAARNDTLGRLAEAQIAAARAPKTAAPTWTCPACSRAMNAQDRFCASCGAPRPA